MTKEKLLEKMRQDMNVQNFSHYTYDFYIRKTKEMIKYFNKSMEEVTVDELSDYLYKEEIKEKVTVNTLRHNFATNNK